MLRFTPVRTFMHTKLAGTMCNAPSGMYVVSEPSPSFDFDSYG